MKMALLKSSAVVSAGTALSRGLGLVREVLMAVFFGTELAKSAFDVAFRIPNLFRRLFGEGALSAAFIPVFTDVLENEGLHAARQLAGRVATLLIAVLSVVTGGGLLVILALMSHGGLGVRVDAVLPMLAIMLPYMIFVCVAALSMGVLNSRGHFAVPALTPVILNVVWILSLFVLCPRFGDTHGERIHGVAWGVLVAGVLQVAAQVPVLVRLGVWPALNMGWGDVRVRRVLLLMGPAALGMGVHQLNVVIDGVLALIVGPWAPAALTYAERLIYYPLGIIATAMGTVLLPTLSRQAARQDRVEMGETIGFSLQCIVLVMAPAAAGLIALAHPLVAAIYVWSGGVFDQASTLVTARALCFYAPGLIVFSMYKVLVPAFYGLKDTRTPVRVGLWMVGLNLVLNIVFILTWPGPYKHAGLALATVLASAGNCGILARLLHRRIGGIAWHAVGFVSLKALVGAAGMALVCRRAYPLVLDAMNSVMAAGKCAEVATVLCVVLIGMCVYALWCVATSFKELRALLTRRRSGALT